MNRIIVLAVASLLAVSGVSADEDDSSGTYEGFIDGNDWRAADEGEKLAYTTGVIDGLVFAEIFQANAQSVGNFVDCINGMSSKQIKVIVQKYLDNNPEKWHQAMNRSVFFGVATACMNERREFS